MDSVCTTWLKGPQLMDVESPRAAQSGTAAFAIKLVSSDLFRPVTSDSSSHSECPETEACRAVAVFHNGSRSVPWRSRHADVTMIAQIWILNSYRHSKQGNVPQLKIPGVRGFSRSRGGLCPQGCLQGLATHARLLTQECPRTCPSTLYFSNCQARSILRGD